MITTPQAVGQVLTQNSYDFVKPTMLRNGLGRVLGVGLILAEGDEHKVSAVLEVQCPYVLLNVVGPTQEPYARFCLPSHQGSLSCFLGQVMRDD